MKRTNMNNLALCRICLSADLKTHSIQNTQLHEIYEKLTSSKLILDGRPATVCYVCRWQLQRCRSIQDKAAKSEEILNQLFQNRIEISQKTVAILNKGIQHNFSSIPLAAFSYNAIIKDEAISIKEEPMSIREKPVGKNVCEENVIEDASDEASVCRVCLSGHVRKMLTNKDNTLQVFEILTNKGDNTPRVFAACHICRAQLLRCRALRNKARKADNILSELLRNGIQLTEGIVSILTRRIKPALTVRPVECASYEIDEERDIFIKQEIENGDGIDEDSYTYKSNIIEIPLEVTKTENEIILPEGYVNESTRSVYTCHLCTYKCTHKSLWENHMRFHDVQRKYVCDICNYRFRTAHNLYLHKRVHARNYQCSECGIVLPGHSQLKKHMATHTGKNILKCVKCNLIFVRRTYFVQHYLEWHPEIRHYCDRCNKSFVREQWLRDHMFRIHASQSMHYICDICNRPLTSKKGLKVHIKIHDSISPHKCEECNRTFQSNYHLRMHMSYHTGERPYACDICGKTFRVKTNLRRHKETHGEKQLSCNICDKKFLRQCTLKYHIMWLHTKERPFGCGKCKSRFVTKFALANHLASHTNDRPYSCIQCRRAFKTRCNLRNHKKQHHSGLPKKIFTCDICKKSTTQKGNLVSHMQYHSDLRPYACDLCDKHFKNKTVLILHRRTHTGEKPHACSICDKKFSQTTALRRHIRSHTGEKPYACDICNKSYPDLASRHRHRSRIHNVVEKYICDLCNRVYIEKTKLKRHIKLHNLQAPYSCNQCEKSFNRLSTLNLHAKVHFGEKVFCYFCRNTFDSRSLPRHVLKAHSGVKSLGCNYCEECFDQLPRLNSHMRRHTGEKPFSCEICDRPYVERRDLQHHMKTIHDTVLVFR